MRIFRTIKRLVRILFVPKHEWVSIANESESIGLIIKYYAWPFIVLGALIKAGSVFVKFTNEADLIQFKIPFSLTILLFYMIVPLFVLIVGGAIIDRFSKSIGATGHKHGALRLLIYSYTPVFIATILINTESHLQYFQYVGVISAYAVVLFWMGMTPMLHILPERRFKFLVFSALTLVFLFFVIMFIIRISLNLLYPEGVILFL
jgi:hypothetical protein